MKNLFVGIIAVVMCFTYSPNANAQDEAGFAPKHVYLDLGIGVPRYSYGVGLYNSSTHYRLPGFSANLQYGFNMFSAGLFLGYTQYGWKSTGNYWDDAYDEYVMGNYNDRHSHFAVGASFTWHIWYFLNHKLNLGLGVESLDLYVTALLGGDIDSHMEQTPLRKDTYVGGGPFFGSVVGAKYYFTKRLGAFLELGYGPSSFATVGVAFKF